MQPQRLITRLLLVFVLTLTLILILTLRTALVPRAGLGEHRHVVLAHRVEARGGEVGKHTRIHGARARVASLLRALATVAKPSQAWYGAGACTHPSRALDKPLSLLRPGATSCTQGRARSDVAGLAPR